ncbi:MAG: MFS transporter, partial [Hyphomicrobiales bacterium]
AGLILGRAILRDMYDRDQAASMIGYVTMGMAVAPMIGPAIAGYLDKFFGWQSSFWLLLVFAVGVLIASYLKVTETNKNPIPSIDFKSLYQSYRELLKIKVFWLYTGLSSCTTGMFFAFLGGAPFISEKVLGLTPDVYGLYFVLVALGYSLGNFLSGRFAARIGVFRMILTGNLLAILSICIISVLFLVFKSSALLLFGPMMILSLSNGLVLPSAVAGAVSVSPRLAGSASGLMGSVQMLVGALLSYLMGIILPLAAVPTVWPLIIAMFMMGCVALAMGAMLKGSGT